MFITLSEPRQAAALARGARPGEAELLSILRTASELEIKTVTSPSRVRTGASRVCAIAGRDARTPPNDPSSATRRTGRNDCNHDAPAGFAAAHG